MNVEDYFFIQYVFEAYQNDEYVNDTKRNDSSSMAAGDKLKISQECKRVYGEISFARSFCS